MSAQDNTNPADDANATTPQQSGATPTPDYDHIAGQAQSIIASQLPNVLALANKLQTSPEHHEDFNQNSVDAAKNLTGWQVPNGMDVAHDPATNSVTLSHQIPISSSNPQPHSEQGVPPAPTINFNLTVINVNTVNIALGGVPSHADLTTPAAPDEMA